MHLRRFAVVAIALLVAGTASSLPAASPRDTLILGTTDKITELSPENNYDYFTWMAFGWTSEGLVQFKPGTTEIVPHLAQSWTVSADGLNYTFRLRTGVTFTDGAPLNAAAVKTSLERVLRLDGPDGAVGLIKGIKTVQAVDARTVRITLKERDATFLSRMTHFVAPSMIYSPRSTPMNEFAKGRFAGTGPYRLVQNVP